MRLPRWTVYPALAVLVLLVVTAVPHVAGDEGEHEGAAARARELHRQLEANRRPIGASEAAGEYGAPKRSAGPDKSR